MATNSIIVPVSTPESTEKPQNGIRGLAHWRHDLLAGLAVSLVSLPLSSGIAIASGAPPIYGIISAVIAGLVFPLVGGSFVTIAGPAAGLAPALLATMVALGGAGNADHVGAGYGRLLVVIFAVGVLQVLLSWLKLARFAAIFPASVVEGMLGAIGVLIVVKSLPMFFGYTGNVQAHSFGEYLRELPTYVAEGSRTAQALAVGALVLMLLTSSRWGKRLKFTRLAPPQLLPVALGMLLALPLGLRALDPGLLIQVPDNLLSGLRMPDFAGLWTDSSLWTAALVGIVTLTLIDGVESLATAFAVDRIDPYKRRSNPDRLLLAMGLSNVLSSLVGGLTIIPGGVKSKTNVAAGGRTLWANTANALCLLAFVVVGGSLIGLIPKAVLGAVLVYTGYRMCEPAVVKHVASVGGEQLLLYAATLVAILATDLLTGILIGTALAFALEAIVVLDANKGSGESASTLLLDMFRNPVTGRWMDGDDYVLSLDRPLSSFNAYHLAPELSRLPQEAQRLRIDLGSHVTLVEHTGLDGLRQMLDSLVRVPHRVCGFEHMHALSQHERCSRIRLDVPSLSRMSLTQRAVLTLGAVIAVSSPMEERAEMVEVITSLRPPAGLGDR